MAKLTIFIISTFFHPYYSHSFVACLQLVTSGFQLYGFHLQDLENNNAVKFPADVASWSVSSQGPSLTLYTQCTSFYLLGGYKVLGINGGPQTGQYFLRNYVSLPVHSMAYFRINFTLLDTWDTLQDYFKVQFDSKIFTSPQIQHSFRYDHSSICGDGSFGEAPSILMYGKFLHSSSSLQLKVISEMSGDSTGESFGFRDVSLLFTSNPLNQTESACHPYTTATALVQFLAYCPCSQSQYKDSSTNSCGACNSYCDGCFGRGPDHCYVCKSTAWFDGARCVDCNIKNMTFYVSGTCRDPCDSSITMHTFIPDYDHVCKGCQIMQVSYVRMLEKGYQYQLSLLPSTCDLAESVLQSQLTITPQTTINFPPFTIQVSRTGTGLYMVNLILQDSLVKATQLNFTLYYLSAAAPAPRKFLPTSFLSGLQQQKKTIQLTMTAVLVGSFAGSITMQASSSLWSIVSFQQFISYLAYINIEYPVQVDLFFSFIEPVAWSLIPDPMSSLLIKLKEKFSEFNAAMMVEANPPQKFIDHDKTSSFLDNGGGAIIFLNIELLFLILAIVLIRRITCLQRTRLLRTIDRNTRWNLPIRTFLENSAPLALAIFLQGRVIVFKNPYFAFIGSLMIFSSVYLIVMMTLVIRVLSCRNIPQLREEEVEKKYGTLSEGVILMEASSKYYYIIILVRSILITFIITFIESIPILQISLLILFNTFFVYYTFAGVTFKSKSLTVINRGNQILILIAEIWILCLYFQTDSNMYYQVVGWLIVGSLGLAIVLELLYVLVLQIIYIVLIFKKLKKLWDTLRSGRNKEKLEGGRRMRRRNKKSKIGRINRIDPDIRIEI